MKFVFLSIVTVLILSLSACGGAPVKEEKGIAPPGRIAFWSNRDGNPEIYVIDTDSSNWQRLTNDPAQDWSTSWSSDGSRIAFASNRDGNFEIYVMDADGSNQQRLTDNLAI
jgi:Tol biopolymer transport system component